ncbi:hypothetical protein PENTCL1PPCAC_754, partial [Pristionchus entomophagus]
LAEMEVRVQNEVVFDNEDEDDDCLVIVDESGSSRVSRKRRRLEEDSLATLRDKVLLLERENKRVKMERDNLLQSSAFPSTKSSRVYTHDIEIDGRIQDFSNYQSTPFRVSGVEFSVGIKQRSSFLSYYAAPSSPGKVTVTPIVSLTTEFEDGPRYVLAMITVTQHSRMQETRPVSCDSTVQMLLDSPMDVAGNKKEFQPTDELNNSRLTIHIRAVVQKLEMPGKGGIGESTVVVVRNKEFRVNAAYLSQWSHYFRAYFEIDMKEKKNGVYPIKDRDISVEDFEELLLVIYPTQKSITVDNYKMLLRLANRFEMPDLIRRIETFLIDFPQHRILKAQLFQLATDTFELPVVQATLLHRWRDAELLKSELLSTFVYKKLQPATKNMINQHFAESSLLFTTSKRADCTGAYPLGYRRCHPESSEDDSDAPDYDDHDDDGGDDDGATFSD